MKYFGTVRWGLFLETFLSFDTDTEVYPVFVGSKFIALNSVTPICVVYYQATIY